MRAGFLSNPSYLVERVQRKFIRMQRGTAFVLQLNDLVGTESLL